MWGWVMRILGGSAGSGHRLECPASLVQKVEFKVRTTLPHQNHGQAFGQAVIAPWRKVSGAQRRGRAFGSTIAYCVYRESAHAGRLRRWLPASAPGAAR